MKTPTDEQLNLAMCELAGWKWEPTLTAYTKENHEGFLWKHELPDYLSPDSPRRLLDDAEARLAEDQFIKYGRKLWDLPISEGRSPISATARQRVIAILQTVKPELFQ